MYRLTFRNGLHKGRRLTIRRARVTVGCGAGCDIRLTDASLAGRHGVIELQGAAALLRRLDADADLRVNGQPVTSVHLADGDIITFGRLDILFQEPRAGSGAHRRMHTMQQAAILLMAGILVAQTLILGSLLLWRLNL